MTISFLIFTPVITTVRSLILKWLQAERNVRTAGNKFYLRRQSSMRCDKVYMLTPEHYHGNFRYEELCKYFVRTGCAKWSVILENVINTEVLLQIMIQRKFHTKLVKDMCKNIAFTSLKVISTLITSTWASGLTQGERGRKTWNNSDERSGFSELGWLDDTPLKLRNEFEVI